MSRYLAYSDLAACKDGLHVIEEKPARLKGASGCLFGPEEAFRDYLLRGYRGGSTILFGARIVSGQFWPNTISTLVMTLGPGFLYWFEVLPRYLAMEGVTLSESFLGVSQSIFGILLIASFFLASFMNPGIIPRGDQVPSNIEVDLRGNPSARFLRINGTTLKQKFCSTCLVFRPPRSKHCSFCDNCVLRFDHHCTWLGNCVGLHNYRFYVCLIYSATLFLIETLWVVTKIFVDLINKGGDDAVLKGILLGVLFFYCLFVLAAVLLLAIYHTVISLQNLTTNEHVKNYYRENPFDFGGFSNVKQIYCFPERVLANGDDTIEADYMPFGSYSDGLSFDDA